MVERASATILEPMGRGEDRIRRRDRHPKSRSQKHSTEMSEKRSFYLESPNRSRHHHSEITPGIYSNYVIKLGWGITLNVFLMHFIIIVKTGLFKEYPPLTNTLNLNLISPLVLGFFGKTLKVVPTNVLMIFAGSFISGWS